jgi:hypothetical protein
MIGIFGMQVIFGDLFGDNFHYSGIRGTGPGKSSPATLLFS